MVSSVATCGGSKTAIPLKVGRVDAQDAGLSGILGLTTDIETTLPQFASAGFGQSDTIALTKVSVTYYRNFADSIEEHAGTLWAISTTPTFQRWVCTYNEPSQTAP